MHPHQRPSGHRYQNHHSVTRKTSFSDDDDAITPCSSPPPEPQELECSATNRTSTSLASFRTTPMLHQHKSLAPTPSSRTTMSTSMRTRHFDPTDGQDMTDSQLWQRMLEIQRTFHCYNSARMSAALLELEMGVDAGHLAPSRSCLDLMNESIADLTEHERQTLAEWVHEHSSTRKKSGTWRRIIHA